MPINVIVADDEYFIRQRIKKIIPWSELNLNFVGEAENGIEVLELLNNNNVDLIILDIKMPKMNGIEVAKQVSEKYPDTKIIILSGYDDFEYARSAMKYRVSDYLLKPIEQSELNEALDKCINKINESKYQKNQMERFFHYNKSINLFKTMSGNLSYQDLCKMFPNILNYSHSAYMSGFIFDDSEDLINNLAKRIRELGLGCNYLKESDYTYTFQLLFRGDVSLTNLQNIINDFISEQKYYMFFVIGQIFKLDESWRPYYRESHYLLNYRYFTPMPKALLSTDIKLSESYENNLSKTRDSIIRLLNRQNTEEFKSYIQNIFQDIRDRNNIDYLQVVITEIFITYNIYYHHLVEFQHNIGDFANLMIDEEYRLSELEDTAIAYGLQCMAKNEALPSNVMLSNKVMDYVNNNYSDPDLTVTSLAEAFELNPSYLGNIFKKTNGQTLLLYITSVRMEASKKLLESNQYKVSEIAEMVGYTDAFYYSKRFKQLYGYSPSQHIKQC